jgi:hypothetical protein
MADPGKVVVAVVAIVALAPTIRTIVMAAIYRLRSSMSKRRVVIGGALLTLALAACAREDTQQTSTRTQREKDSILANSQIPGARAVKKTLTTTDSVAARAARIDSAQESP